MSGNGAEAKKARIPSESGGSEKRFLVHARSIVIAVLFLTCVIVVDGTSTVAAGIVGTALVSYAMVRRRKMV